MVCTVKRTLRHLHLFLPLYHHQPSNTTQNNQELIKMDGLFNKAAQFASDYACKSAILHVTYNPRPEGGFLVMRGP